MSTEITSRDRVWKAVLQALRESDEIRARDVRENLGDNVDHMTRKRTMWAMNDLGVLKHEEGEKKWRRGPDYEYLCG